MKYSIIIPCYCSSKSISEVVETTKAELEKQKIDSYEFVLVNDCSPDGGQTIGVLKEMASQDRCIKVVDLAKNSGQHNAIMAGMRYAAGEYIIGMDDDGQTAPSEIIKLKTKMDEGYDIVYGYYPEKKQHGFRLFGSWLNHVTVRILLNKPKSLKTSSFWMIRKFVRDYAIEYSFPTIHLQGVFLRITRNIASTPIEHFERKYGQSTYSFKKLVRLYLNIVGFSMTPLRVIMAIGGIFSLAGFLLSVFWGIAKLLNPNIVMGWTSIVCVQSFFSGMVLLGIGVVGDYIGRLYQGQTKTPQYVVRDTMNVDDDEKAL